MRRIITLIISLAVFVSIFAALVNLNRHRRLYASEEQAVKGRSGAMQALDFWTRSRAYPYKDIPADKYYRSYQLSKAKQKEFTNVLTAGGTWAPIGPTNLQGRAISVALNPLNPNTLYIGSASGGLWRSYSAGVAGDWRQVKLGYPALGIGAIVIDPTDTNVIYLGTGEVYGYQAANGGVTLRTLRGSYGIGILKTTDGGETWTKSLDWSYNNQSGVEAMKMNPLNHNTLWAATTEGLYKSVDAGHSWNVVVAVELGEDIMINPLDTNKIMVSFGDLNSPQTGIYRTLNGGSFWSKANAIPAFTGKARLELYGASPNVVYASVGADSTLDNGGLWRSTDFGSTWTLLCSPLGLFQVQGWYSHFVAVNPTDSSQVVFAGVPITKSTNGGLTFFNSSGSYSDHHNYAHHPTNPNILYVVNDDGVYRSDDFGSSFVDVGLGMQTGQFYNGFSCSRTDSFLAMGQSQDHIPGYRYLGSSTWDRGVEDEVGWTAINQSDDHYAYAVNRYGEDIFRSSDRGASFPYMYGFDGSGGWNSPFVLSPANTNVLYFGDVHIYKSTDGGWSWSVTNGGAMLDGNPALSMAISPTSPETVYVGMAPVNTSAHVFRTTNGGGFWQDISGTLPDRYPMDLMVDPQHSQTVYAAIGGFGTGHLFKSTDAGSNWTDITGSLPDAPTTAVAIDPLHSNIVYAGNDLGVYVSTDGGTNWSAYNQGLPDAVIAADLVISPSNRALRIATHGNGVWERKLVGELPTNYLDYEALSLDNPIDGGQYELGASLTPLRATFESLSLQAPADSFNVRYQIVQGSNVFYSNTKRIAALAPGESRTVIFDGSFSPPDTGYYVLQAISLFVDMNSHDDTLKGIITVVFPPTISSAVVVKQSSPYSEITGGLPGPAGDDVESRVGLPFLFVYDGYPYDSVQISTNGWMEFGIGTPGSLRGLSTAEQIGGTFNPGPRVDAERPTKVLGPWWADLSTGPSGQITYQTLGTAPNRVFVVQWKNILAYYDASSTTTYLNFQVRLSESSNFIDLCYGPLVMGTYPAGAGATIDMKDYIGGDYRYYDIYSGAVGPMGAIASDLNPLADWPGQDSRYHITTKGITGVRNPQMLLPTAFHVSQNYPNPFNPTTRIAYELPTASKVTLTVFDLQGRKVATLVDAVQEAGAKSVEWNSANANAGSVASGIYFYRIVATSIAEPSKSFTQARKMLLLK